MKKFGTLYVVATPIGNLNDMTFRAIEILKKVSLIASEDTRTTGRLLKYFDIKTPLTSYHEHNELEKSKKIINVLENGEDVAIVSEAGTPAISDPGYRLLSSSVEAGVEMVPIPGAVAAIAALSVSGLPTDKFLFCGFLPDKKGKRLKKLEKVKDIEATLIFYISKWKVEKTLQDMLEVLGDRRVCFCRELTKLHEEVRHSNLEELLEYLKGRVLKGEVTLVVGGNE